LLTSQISFDDAVDVEDGIVVNKRRIINLQADEWLQLLKFLYAQVDGPPPSKMELTGEGGGPIETRNISIDELIKLDPRELAKRYSEALTQSKEA